LRETIVPFILEKLSLSPVEFELMSFASILRLPGPRELFRSWRGEEANDLLNSLVSQYLIESSEDGYLLHPLVREFYYYNLPIAQATEFHRVAGRFYNGLLDKERKTNRRIVPEFLGEAVHHYLAAGDRQRFQQVSFYKEELKPVAVQHYRKGDLEAALKDYRVLVEIDDRDADAHFHLALIYARRKRWNDAELHFGKAITLRPRTPRMLQGYAAAKIRADKLAEAEQLLDEALEVKPDHSPSLAEFGRLREKQGYLAEAEEYYNKAIEADPNNFMAYYRLARLLYQQNEIAQAFEMAQAAVQTNPLDDRSRALLKELKEKLEGK